MCFSKAKWKREVVNDHKFDFVCVEDFKINDVYTRLRYCFLHLIILKTILVYVADLWTAGILLIFNRWSTSIQPAIPIRISKWIYVGCIFISFFLLFLEWKKAKRIIISRDISYAFTSTIASRYYTLRSYSHYCFFCRINEQKRRADNLAFFVFFTFKDWKKLIAEAPRQLINGMTLYSIYQTTSLFGHNHYHTVEYLTMILMAFTNLVYAISALKLLIAFLLYIPLLFFYIRGNLKEYCCHKIDKRIEELLKKNSRERRKKQQMIDKAIAKRRRDKVYQLRKPTLPNLDNNINQFNNQMPPSMPPPMPPPPPPPPHRMAYNSTFRPPHFQQTNFPYNSNLQQTNFPGFVHDSGPRPPVHYQPPRPGISSTRGGGSSNNTTVPTRYH